MTNFGYIPLCLLVLSFAAPAFAAIWTDRLGDYVRVSATPVMIENRILAEEYGIEQAERAEYENGNQRFTATAYQMVDSTGGVAMYQFVQPEGARPSEFETKALEEDFELFSVEAGTTTVVNYENYVMTFEGGRPTWDVVKAFLGFAPNLGVSSRPTLPGYLPTTNLVPGSRRYILGPESLSLFLKEVPASVAAFSMGAEGQVAEYEQNGSRAKLAIVSYPTPQMARKKLEEYQQLSPDHLMKRESSLIAFIPSPQDRDLAERVLAQVQYRGTVTINQKVTTEAEELRNLIINVIILTVVLGLLAAVAGLAFGGLRYFRRGHGSEEDEAIVRLHID